MSAHHRHSPSGAEKWFNCWGSLNQEDGLPDETSEYSSEGTAAHTIRERCLRLGTDVLDYVGEWVRADDLYFQVTTEWAAYLQPGIERIREAKGFTWVFEHRTEMDPWIPGGFGTLDAGGISKKLIIIDDLKFGRGVTVEADRNKQLMIYALGFWMNYARHRTKATRFLLRIDQPRVAGGGDEWYVELDELLEFAEELALAVQRTLDPNAPLTPTQKGCQFCKAARNGRCKTLDLFVLAMLGLTYDDLCTDEGKPTLPNVSEMTAERKAYILTHKSMINSWVAQIHGIALHDAQMGEEIPGYKVVETEGDRAWTSEQEAEEFLKGKIPDKEMFTKRLKSPPQMELAVGTRTWAKAQHLITRPAGAPALVPESDKRPALLPLMDLLDNLDDMDDTEEDFELLDLLGGTTTETTGTTDPDDDYDNLL